MQQGKWIVVTGFLLWVVCGVPTMLSIWTGAITGWAAIVWCIAFAGFGATLALGALAVRLSRWRDATLFFLIVTVVCGFGMTLLSVEFAKYTAALSFAIVAGRLPYVASERASWFATLGILAALLLHFGLYGRWLAVFIPGGLAAASMIFALNHGIKDLREQRARAELLAVNAELHATRELLAENSRVAERLRISRDLHDTLGHHLTALSIQLDVAARRSEGRAAEHIREAHAITRLLLSDVRDVVGQLRGAGSVEVVEQIRRLTHSIGDLNIHLDIPDILDIDDPIRGDTLVRCVQEAITNARRHAAAHNLWIRIAATSDGVELHVRDDGRGADRIDWGHGLTGMRERFSEQGGRIEVTSRSQGGFALQAFLPDREATS